MKTIIIILNIWLGLWLGGMAIYQFIILKGGGSISEPNETIATIELVVACLITAWFAFQIPYFIIRRKNDTQKTNS